MVPTEEQIRAEARRQSDGRLTFEDKDVQVWLNRAAMFKRQGRDQESNEAYVIAYQLQAVPDEIERQWWETNADRVLHIAAAMVTGKQTIQGATDIVEMAAQIVRVVTDKAAKA